MAISSSDATIQAALDRMRAEKDRDDAVRARVIAERNLELLREAIGRHKKTYVPKPPDADDPHWEPLAKRWKRLARAKEARRRLMGFRAAQQRRASNMLKAKPHTGVFAGVPGKPGVKVGLLVSADTRQRTLTGRDIFNVKKQYSQDDLTDLIAPAWRHRHFSDE